MTQRLVAAAIVGAALIGSPVLAFQASPTAARGALDAQSAYAERLQRQALDGPTERAAATDPDQNPRRARRAQAAAALINAGDCDGALALAQKEHDQRLEARINLVCASVDVSAPSLAPDDPATAAGPGQTAGPSPPSRSSSDAS